MANCFGHYSSSVTDNELTKHFEAARSTSCTVSAIIDQTFFFRFITPDEVICFVNNFQNKFSTGLDNISVKVMRSLISYITDHIAHLINLSICSGKFPSCLKTAT